MSRLSAGPRVLAFTLALSIALAGCVQQKTEPGAGATNATSGAGGGAGAGGTQGTSGTSGTEGSTGSGGSGTGGSGSSTGSTGTGTSSPAPLDNLGAKVLLQRALVNTAPVKRAIEGTLSMGDTGIEFSSSLVVSDPAAGIEFTEMRYNPLIRAQASSSPTGPVLSAMLIYAKGDAQVFAANGTAYVLPRNGTSTNPASGFVEALDPLKQLPDFAKGTVKSVGEVSHRGKAAATIVLAFAKVNESSNATVVVYKDPPRIAKVDLDLAKFEAAKPETDNDADFEPQCARHRLPEPDYEDYTDEESGRYAADYEAYEDSYATFERCVEDAHAAAHVANDNHAPLPPKWSRSRVVASFLYEGEVTYTVPERVLRAHSLAFNRSAPFAGAATDTWTFLSGGVIPLSDMEVRVLRPAAGANASDPTKGTLLWSVPLAPGTGSRLNVTLTFDDADHDGRVSKGDTLRIDRATADARSFLVALFDKVSGTYVLPGAGLLALLAGLAVVAAAARARIRRD